MTGQLGILQLKSSLLKNCPEGHSQLLEKLVSRELATREQLKVRSNSIIVALKSLILKKEAVRVGVRGLVVIDTNEPCELLNCILKVKRLLYEL